MIWNRRGLTDLAKHKHIAHFVGEHGLDCCHHQGGRHDFPVHVLDHISEGGGGGWLHLPLSTPMREVWRDLAWSSDFEDGFVSPLGWVVSYKITSSKHSWQSYVELGRNMELPKTSINPLFFMNWLILQRITHAPWSLGVILISYDTSKRKQQSIWHTLEFLVQCYYW